jgi:hypothetical protein
MDVCEGPFRRQVLEVSLRMDTCLAVPNQYKPFSLAAVRRQVHAASRRDFSQPVRVLHETAFLGVLICFQLAGPAVVFTAPRLLFSVDLPGCRIRTLWCGVALC